MYFRNVLSREERALVRSLQEKEEVVK
jgi:hypothetical protein